MTMTDIPTFVHEMIVQWGIDYQPILTPIAFDELHHRLAVAMAADRGRCAASLRNAAYVVRRDGGSEERARTFEDAAEIVKGSALPPM